MSATTHTVTPLSAIAGKPQAIETRDAKVKPLSPAAKAHGDYYAKGVAIGDKATDAKASDKSAAAASSLRTVTLAAMLACAAWSGPRFTKPQNAAMAEGIASVGKVGASSAKAYSALAVAFRTLTADASWSGVVAAAKAGDVDKAVAALLALELDSMRAVRAAFGLDKPADPIKQATSAGKRAATAGADYDAAVAAFIAGFNSAEGEPADASDDDDGDVVAPPVYRLIKANAA